MSYGMNQFDTQFFMELPDLEAARQSLLSAVVGCDWFNIKSARTLEYAVAQFSWNLEFDDDGNVNGIELMVECAGDEKRLFNAIAPYVKAGSYIQMVGEDGDLWRWIFDGMLCTEQKPTIGW